MERAALFLALFVPCCLGFITWIVPNLPLPGDRAPPGSPWPYPVSLQNSSVFHLIRKDQFQIIHNLGECDILDYNYPRYLNFIFPEDVTPSGEALLTRLDINVESGDCEYALTFESDESYQLDITENSALATLTAPTVWGALRGLETFSQLVWQDESKQYQVNATRITDSPRFKHRGVLLDTARHFIPVSILKQNLDAMQINKFNVFHWHLVDDQSFPFESTVFPDLTAKGVYIPSHVYRQTEIKDLVEYARFRGIRVVVELDTPGHTRAIGNSYPELLTPCYGDGENPYTPDYPNFSEMEVFNPTNPQVYDFMRQLITELKSVFNYEQYIHLGMDEVTYGCWASNPDIQEFMAQNNLSRYSELEDYYVQQLLPIVADIGFKRIIYQEPVDNGVNVPLDTIINVWRDVELDSSMKPWRDYIVPIVEKGYQVILSSCWYLNYISYGPDWKKYYQCDPQSFPGSQDLLDLVIGGEAALWAEYVDGTNLLSRIWPRASAVAERLWSPKEVNDVDSANFRLDQLRCKMLRRGLPAAPILNGYCGDYEWDA